MTSLLSSKVKFEWSDACRVAFEKVKAMLSNSRF